MAYFLLNENRIVDELPETARLCKKFVDTKEGREFYLTWHGAALRRVSVYLLRSTGRANEERLARVEIDGSEAAVERVCALWQMRREWTVADYRP